MRKLTAIIGWWAGLIATPALAQSGPLFGPTQGEILCGPLRSFTLEPGFVSFVIFNFKLIAGTRPESPGECVWIGTPIGFDSTLRYAVLNYGDDEVNLDFQGDRVIRFTIGRNAPEEDQRKFKILFGALIKGEAFRASVTRQSDLRFEVTDIQPAFIPSRTDGALAEGEGSRITPPPRPTDPYREGEPIAPPPISPDTPYREGRTLAESLIVGTFDTTFGRMKFNGYNPAKYDRGTIYVSRIDGPVMEGVWIQQRSDQRCADGSYAGRFRFTFTLEGFTGLYGYCDAAPNLTGWNGTRRR